MEMLTELEMSESEAMEFLLETHQLSKVDEFLLEASDADDSLLPDEMIAQYNSAMQRLLLMMAGTPTPAYH